MQRLLISYDLVEPSWTEMTRTLLYDELKSLGAVQIQNSVWITNAGISVTYASTKLRVYFGKLTVFWLRASTRLRAARDSATFRRDSNVSS